MSPHGEFYEQNILALHLDPTDFFQESFCNIYHRTNQDSTLQHSLKDYKYHKEIFLPQRNSPLKDNKVCHEFFQRKSLLKWYCLEPAQKLCLN